MPDEDVGRGATHCGQCSHLARELHAAAHGVGDHVEDLRERATDLALDVDCQHDELEVLRAQPVGHRLQGLVGGAAEPGLGLDALELLGDRARARPGRSSTSPAGTTGRRAATRPRRSACRRADPRSFLRRALALRRTMNSGMTAPMIANTSGKMMPSPSTKPTSPRATISPAWMATNSAARIEHVRALEQLRHALEVGRAAERALTAQHEQVAHREALARAPRSAARARPWCSGRGGGRAPSRAGCAP